MIAFKVFFFFFRTFENFEKIKTKFIITTLSIFIESKCKYLFNHMIYNYLQIYFNIFFCQNLSQIFKKYFTLEGINLFFLLESSQNNSVNSLIFMIIYSIDF